MMLIRRKAPTPMQVAKPTLTQTQVQIEKPTMRLRAVIAGSASDNFARTAKAKVEIEGQLKLISNAYQQIDEAQAVVEQAFKVIEAQLRLVNLKEHSDGMYIAALEEVWTRQSRTIDPKKFRAHVAADVFWDSIKVSLDKAGKHLSEKELGTISDVVESKKTGIALKVSKVKQTKRR